MPTVRVSPLVQVALLAAGMFAPLCDSSGEPYDSNRLPCVAKPDMWDDDASAIDQYSAKLSCATCPAIMACRERALMLGDLARGVWGGMIMEREDEAPLVYDSTVAAWIVSSGVTLRVRGQN